MTKEEFYEWKSSPFTQEILDLMKNQVGKLEYGIARSVGEDGKQDLIRRGYILAFEDIIRMEYDETEKTEQ